MSKIFVLFSVVLFALVIVTMMFDVNTTYCTEPYEFSATSALGILSMLFLFWGLGFLTGATHQMDKDN